MSSLLGDPATADHIFLLEGQWDVLAALVSALWSIVRHWDHAETRWQTARRSLTTLCP